MLHPTGTVRIDYAEGVGPTTRLEGLGEGRPVATMTFVADGAERSSALVVRAEPATTRLVMNSSDPPFRLCKGWVRYWPGE
jgi:hypothetical protein